MSSITTPTAIGSEEARTLSKLIITLLGVRQRTVTLHGAKLLPVRSFDTLTNVQAQYATALQRSLLSAGFSAERPEEVKAFFDSMSMQAESNDVSSVVRLPEICHIGIPDIFTAASVEEFLSAAEPYTSLEQRTQKKEGWT